VTRTKAVVPELILSKETGTALPAGLVQTCVSRSSISLCPSTRTCAEHNCIFHNSFISAMGAMYSENRRYEESLTAPFASQVSLPASTCPAPFRDTENGNPESFSQGCLVHTPHILFKKRRKRKKMHEK